MNKQVYFVVLLVVIVGGAMLYIVYNRGDGSESADLENGAAYNPQIDPADFTTKIDNPYFTLTPGRKLSYEARKAEGLERIEVYVTTEKKTVLGVEVVVVWDRVWLNDSLIEETKDWYAQDKAGNVWYFGEDSVEMENGKIISHHGSWEAGVDGAKPGIIMKADPQIGDSYREEYYQGEAEDMADVLSTTEDVTVPLGSYTDCLQTKNYTALEPNVLEYKYYCRVVGGVALEVNPEDNERTELIAAADNAMPSPSIVEKPAPKTSPVGNTSPATTPNQPATNTPPSNGGNSTNTPPIVITEAQAKAIALQRVPGVVTNITIEQKYGKDAYVVEIDADNGPETDVVVDMATGEVLGVE